MIAGISLHAIHACDGQIDGSLAIDASTGFLMLVSYVCVKWLLKKESVQRTNVGDHGSVI